MMYDHFSTSKKVIFEEMQITCLGGRIGGFEHYACGTPKPEQLCHQTNTWFGSIRKKEKFHHVHSKPKCTIAYKAILIFVLNLMFLTQYWCLLLKKNAKLGKFCALVMCVWLIKSFNTLNVYNMQEQPQC